MITHTIEYYTPSNFNCKSERKQRHHKGKFTFEDVADRELSERYRDMGIGAEYAEEHLGITLKWIFNDGTWAWSNG